MKTLTKVQRLLNHIKDNNLQLNERKASDLDFILANVFETRVLDLKTCTLKRPVTNVIKDWRFRWCTAFFLDCGGLLYWTNHKVPSESGMDQPFQVFIHDVSGPCSSSWKSAEILRWRRERSTRLRKETVTLYPLHSIILMRSLQVEFVLLCWVPIRKAAYPNSKAESRKTAFVCNSPLFWVKDDITWPEERACLFIQWRTSLVAKSASEVVQKEWLQ
jgi:hypothetical protein